MLNIEKWIYKFGVAIKKTHFLLNKKQFERIRILEYFFLDQIFRLFNIDFSVLIKNGNIDYNKIEKYIIFTVDKKEFKLNFDEYSTGFNEWEKELYDNIHRIPRNIQWKLWLRNNDRYLLKHHEDIDYFYNPHLF